MDLGPPGVAGVAPVRASGLRPAGRSGQGAGVEIAREESGREGLGQEWGPRSPH